MKLKPIIDYYYEDNKMIFTREYLVNRGKCCNNACKNCPYTKPQKKNWFD